MTSSGSKEEGSGLRFCDFLGPGDKRDLLLALRKFTVLKNKNLRRTQSNEQWVNPNILTLSSTRPVPTCFSTRTIPSIGMPGARKLWRRLGPKISPSSSALDIRRVTGAM